MKRFYHLDLSGDDQDEDLARIDQFVQGTGFGMKHHHMSLGTPATPWWPADASVQIRKDRGLRLTDLIGVTTHHITVSTRFVDVIKRVLQPNDSIEFLPVVIHDPRGRVLASDYFIVNPLDTVDCLDLEASRIAWSDKPGPPTIISVRDPVLSDAKLTHPRSLFRIQDSPMDYVLAYPLASAMLEAKLTNIFWKRLELR